MDVALGVFAMLPAIVAKQSQQEARSMGKLAPLSPGMTRSSGQPFSKRVNQMTHHMECDASLSLAWKHSMLSIWRQWSGSSFRKLHVC